MEVRSAMGQADEEAHSQEAVGAALPPVAALVERFQQRLGTYLLHLVGDLDHALVLAEQTFVRAHFAGLASGPELSAQVWLYGVATQLAFADLRRRRPVPHEVAEGRDVVRAVLAQLHPDERAALLLADKQGLHEAEVAAILGQTADQIQRQLKRARTRFRDLYVRQHTLSEIRPPNGANACDGGVATDAPYSPPPR